METVIITATLDPARLRAAMVGSLTAGGHLRTPAIIDAFTEAERHLFLPGTGLEAAYDNDAVPVKHVDDGTMISLHLRAVDRRHPAGAARRPLW
jgi:protein-L-isoaspartate(D-aspartate) O-methyltransferase